MWLRQLTAAGVEISFVDLSKPGALDATTCPPPSRPRGDGSRTGDPALPRGDRDVLFLPVQGGRCETLMLIVILERRSTGLRGVPALPPSSGNWLSMVIWPSFLYRWLYFNPSFCLPGKLATFPEAGGVCIGYQQEQRGASKCPLKPPFPTSSGFR